MAFFSVEPGITRDEGGREHALAEEVLQKIWNAKGGAEGIGSVGVAEIMREDPITHPASDPTEQNAESDSQGMSSTRRVGFSGVRVQTGIIGAITARQSPRGNLKHTGVAGKACLYQIG